MIDIENLTVVDLEQPRRSADPIFPAHVPGTLLMLHRRHEEGHGESRTSASGIIVTAEHAGTHIDALSHQAEAMQLHGGIRVTSAVQTPFGFAQLGAETIPPLVSHAVLLDVAALRTVAPGGLITREDLRAAADEADIAVQRGDVVLVRTGYGAFWSSPARYLQAPGIVPDGSEWLADLRVRAVGADNVAWDLPGYVDPQLGCTLPGHVYLIVRAGIYIIENLNLEALAAASSRRFVFICLPLKIVGGTGCPVRPIALLDGTPQV